MSRPQTTSLVLLSEYVLETNVNSGTLSSLDTTTALRLRGGLLKASNYVQRMARRRFDERIETRKFTALDERIGGALANPYILQLDDDLKSVSTITNGDGTVLTTYKLVHWSEDLGIQVYSRIHLNVFGGALWRSGGSDPWESIFVAGLWGYGGQWLDTGTTLTADSGSTITVVAGTALEVGMMLKIDTEYLYVDGISTNTVTVARAMNGSTQATHSGGTAVYRWEALDSVRDLVIRLVQWRQEQRKAPLAGQVTVGDFTFPVDTNGLPKDLYLAMRDLSLSATENSLGV